MDADPSLRRFERDMVVACLAMAAIALVLRGGRLDAALGVLGGGALIGFSYRAIKGAVDALLARAPGVARAGAEGERDAALGVLGGGALVGFSYRAIKGAVDGILARAVAVRASAGEGAAEAGAGQATTVTRPRGDRIALALALVKLFTRYALLALGAYVMLRFRLHPVGLIAGASSPVLAAGAEAVRLLGTTGGRSR